MLKRIVVVITTGLMVVALTACNLNLPGVPNLPLSNTVAQKAPQPSPQPTQVVEPVATAVVIQATFTAVAPDTPEPPSPTPTQMGTATPSPTPAIVIKFNTPALGLTLVPKGSPAAPAESTPLVVVPKQTTAATAVAPAELKGTGQPPEIVWLDDSPEFGTSKPMGWVNGASSPILPDGKKHVTGWIDDFSVSPGGQWLAYTTVDSPLILLVNTVTGEQRKVSPPQRGWGFRSPVWSPDGTRLAFIAEFQSLPGTLPFNVGLWTAAADGTDVRQVSAGEGWLGQRMTLAKWNPNGKELLYSLTGLYGQAVPRWLTVPVSKGNPDFLPLSGTLYDISPDSTWLLGDGLTTAPPVGRQKHSYNVLMQIPVDGKVPKVLTPACRSDIKGRISPHGLKIAFLSMPSIAPTCPRVSGPTKYELWVMNSDGTERKQIDSKSVIGRDSPQWSADGSRLYYVVLGNKGPMLWQAAGDGETPPTVLAHTLGADRFFVVH